MNNLHSTTKIKIITLLSYSLMTLSKLLILAVSSLHVTYEHNFGLACFTARRKGQFFPNENKEPLDHV